MGINYVYLIESVENGKNAYKRVHSCYSSEYAARQALTYLDSEAYQIFQYPLIRKVRTEQ